MHLGLLTASYPRYPGDPAGNFVAEHAAALRSLGHAVDVVAAGDPAAPADAGALWRVPSPLFYRGGAPDHLARAPLAALPTAAAFTARFTRAAARAARQRRWEGVIAHWLAPSALAALAAPALRDLPLIAIAHGGDVHTLRRLHVLAPILAALRRRGARVVFTSAQLRGAACAAAPRLARWLAAQCAVQPMGISLARFAAIGRARAAWGARPTGERPMLLVAARLVPVKGVEVALAALAHLPPASPGAPAPRLVIAGDGPERAALAPLAARTGAVLLGEVTTERRDELLRDARLVIVPSRALPDGRTEGTPLIAIEALAAGVPVVAAAVGGLTELAGVATVPPDDPRALAAAIGRTLAAPPPAIELQRAVAHLDWPAVAARLLRSE